MTGRRDEPQQEGFTLIEVTVVMAVLGVVLGMIFGALVMAQRDVVMTSASADAVAQARLALAQIDRQVRSGNVLYNPDDEAVPLSMRIYTQANGDQRCVQWAIDSDHNLRTRSWTPVALPGDAPDYSPWRTIATGIVNADEDDQRPFSLHGGGVDNDYRARVLDVVLMVNPSGRSDVNTVNVKTSLTGRNTQYGYNADRCGTS